MAARDGTVGDGHARQFNFRRLTDPRLGPSIAYRMRFDEAVAMGFSLSDAREQAELERAAVRRLLNPRRA